MNKMHRQIAALCIAPLAVPLLQLPWLLGAQLPVIWLATGLVLASATGYLGTLLFAIPAYRLLTVPGILGALTAGLTGFACGALMWLVFAAFFALSLGQGRAGLTIALTNPNSLKGMLWPGGASGFCVALVFWSIMFIGRRRQPSG